MTTDAWEKTGRDAAHEDIAGGAEPCTTLDEARRRIGQWLRSQTPAVAAADAEACAAAYLRAWEAHARDTSPAGLDLDAIEMRSRDNEDFRTYHLAQDSAADVPALLARVRDLTAKLDATAQAFDGLVAQVWRATGEEHEPPADVEAMLARVAQLRAVRDMAVTSDARREGAEAMREACAEVAAEHEAAARSRRSAFHHDDRGYDIADAAIDECEEVAAAIRALPLPEAPQ